MPWAEPATFFTCLLSEFYKMLSKLSKLHTDFSQNIYFYEWPRKCQFDILTRCLSPSVSACPPARMTPWVSGLLFISAIELCSGCLFLPPPTPPTPAPSPGPPPSTSCQCGRANTISKIVGGVNTDVNEYPWQVGLISSQSSSRSECNVTRQGALRHISVRSDLSVAELWSVTRRFSPLPTVGRTLAGWCWGSTTPTRRTANRKFRWGTEGA